MLSSQLCFELLDAGAEVGIGGQALGDALAGVDDSGVVAAADGDADLGGAQARVLLREIHSHLTAEDGVGLAAGGEEVGTVEMENLTGLLQDVVDGDFAALLREADGAGDDVLGHGDIDFAAVDDAVDHEGVDDALEVADALIYVLGDEVDNGLGDVEAVAANLHLQDVAAQVHVGALQLGQQAPLEARQQALLHALQRHGRAVAGEDELAAVLVEVVEDVEEGELRLLLSGKLLHIVDDEHVDALVEADEVVDLLLQVGVDELYLEQVGGDVEHAQLGVELTEAVADGVDQVGLADAGAAVDEQRVERGLLGVLRNGSAHGEGELVGGALDEVVEGVGGVQLRVELLQGLRRLVDGRGYVYGRGGYVGGGGQIHGDVVGGIGRHLIDKAYACAIYACEHGAQQLDVVGLDVFIDEGAGNA